MFESTGHGHGWQTVSFTLRYRYHLEVMVAFWAIHKWICDRAKDLLWTVLSNLTVRVDIEDACEWSDQCSQDSFKATQVNRHPERSCGFHETNSLQSINQAAPLTVRSLYSTNMELVTVVGLLFHPKVDIFLGLVLGCQKMASDIILGSMEVPCFSYRWLHVIMCLIILPRRVWSHLADSLGIQAIFYFLLLQRSLFTSDTLETQHGYYSYHWNAYEIVIIPIRYPRPLVAWRRYCR